MTQKITTSEGLLSLLLSINTASFVGVTSITEPRMRKTGNPFNGRKVQKMTTQTLQWGYSYENAVNNRTDGDCEFTAQPLKWGEWLVPNKVITHKGNLYARFYKVDNESAPVSVAYLIDGVFATEEEEETIKAFLYAPSESNRQAEAGLTENQVKPRDFSFASIVGVRVNGETYDITHETSPAVATAKA